LFIAEFLLGEHWDAADFGGSAGIIQFIKTHLPDGERRKFLLANGNLVRLHYADYDWRLNVT